LWAETDESANIQIKVAAKFPGAGNFGHTLQRDLCRARLGSDNFSDQTISTAKKMLWESVANPELMLEIQRLRFWHFMCSL
jgi:hypothetical protein